MILALSPTLPTLSKVLDETVAGQWTFLEINNPLSKTHGFTTGYKENL